MKILEIVLSALLFCQVLSLKTTNNIINTIVFLFILAYLAIKVFFSLEWMHAVGFFYDRIACATPYKSVCIFTVNNAFIINPVDSSANYNNTYEKNSTNHTCIAPQSPISRHLRQQLRM